jgi:hypothetical protein
MSYLPNDRAKEMQLQNSSGEVQFGALLMQLSLRNARKRVTGVSS